MRIRSSIRFILTVGLALALAACSPKHDWRVVHNQEHGWQATFPGKPVQFSRELLLPGASAPVRLTLSSAKIDDAMFAVGWIANANESSRKALESAMLANINARPSSIRRGNANISGLQGTAVEASGEMRIEAGKAPVPVRMMMRSIAISGPQPVVIEIIAVGPEASLPTEIAQQFVESLRIVR